MDSPFGPALRDRFCLDPAVTYLNHGAFGATPRSVLAAQRQWQAALERNPTRFQEVEREPALDRAIARVGALVGARPADLVFVDNATTGANAVLQSFPLSPGDEVLVLGHAYPAVRHAVEVIADRVGARVTVAPIPIPLEDGEQVVDAVRRALSGATRLAVLDHVTSGSALVMPIARLVEVCRARGVPVLVDGAHAAGAIPLDLEVIGADFYTGNLHKWAFAPKGTGFLHVAEHRQSDLQPPVLSHPSEDWRGAFHWQGTTDPSAWLASSAGIDFLQGLGPEADAYRHELVSAATALLADAWGTLRPFPPELHGTMAVLEAPGGLQGTREEARALSRRLREAHAIEVAVFPWGGRCWVRISAQVYNGLEDYARLARAITPR